MQADIGIIGGSGFYSFLSGVERVSVDTPFGEPSAPVALGRLAGRRVAFLPRHGTEHQFPPHRVNYRANLWALRSVGVRQVLAPCAVGGLTAALAPGTFVVPDQVVDRTWGRGQHPHPPGRPYRPRGRAALLDAGMDAVDGGTLVVINGPRFSTRAESTWHAAAGWSVVGMTGMPEASIARDLAMCFSTVCMVTDADAGVEGAGVTHAEVLEVFGRNIDRLKAMLLDVIGALPDPEADDLATCSCRRVLDGMPLPLELP